METRLRNEMYRQDHFGRCASAASQRRAHLDETRHHVRSGQRAVNASLLCGWSAGHVDGFGNNSERWHIAPNEA